jgi:hypothetical protein
LVPPTWKKVFGTYLEWIWDAAVHRLNSATRIIIIGFSIPPADMHFKYLIAAGLQKNASLRQILFVNPATKEDLEPRVRRHLREAYIDSKLIDFKTMTLDEFMRNTASPVNNFERIARPGEDRVNVHI